MEHPPTADADIHNQAQETDLTQCFMLATGTRCSRKTVPGTPVPRPRTWRNRSLLAITCEFRSPDQARVLSSSIVDWLSLTRVVLIWPPPPWKDPSGLLPPIGKVLESAIHIVTASRARNTLLLGCTGTSPASYSGLSHTLLQRPEWAALLHLCGAPFVLHLLTQCVVLVPWTTSPRPLVQICGPPCLGYKTPGTSSHAPPVSVLLQFAALKTQPSTGKLDGKSQMMRAPALPVPKLLSVLPPESVWGAARIPCLAMLYGGRARTLHPQLPRLPAAWGCKIHALAALLRK
eukprot:gene769-2530_t